MLHILKAVIQINTSKILWLVYLGLLVSVLPHTQHTLYAFEVRGGNSGWWAETTSWATAISIELFSACFAHVGLTLSRYWFTKTINCAFTALSTLVTYLLQAGFYAGHTISGELVAAILPAGITTIGITLGLLRWEQNKAAQEAASQPRTIDSHSPNSLQSANREAKTVSRRDYAASQPEEPASQDAGLGNEDYAMASPDGEEDYEIPSSFSPMFTNADGAIYLRPRPYLHSWVKPESTYQPGKAPGAVEDLTPPEPAAVTFEQRRAFIANLLSRFGRVDKKQLAAQFKVTVRTIEKDISAIK